MSSEAELQPWFLCGRVVHGHGRGGTQLGFPTANIELNETVTQELQPYNNSVFYGWGCVTMFPSKEDLFEGPHPFAMSVGFNPHFKDKDLSAEVHFLHKFPEDFYGAVVKVIVLGKIRPQAAFTTLDALIDIIHGDIRYTKEALQRSECEKYRENSLILPTSNSLTFTGTRFELLDA